MTTTTHHQPLRPEAEPKEQLLESTIFTEWDGRREPFQRSMFEQSVRLEEKGSPVYLLDKFSAFMDLLRFMYDTRIRGESLESELASQFKDYTEDNPNLSELRIPPLFWENRTIEGLINLSQGEYYKLQAPLYLLTRGAKELVKASPIGAAIAEYRRTHPLLPLPSLPEGITNFAEVGHHNRDGYFHYFEADREVQILTKPVGPYLEDEDYQKLRYGLQMEYEPFDLSNHCSLFLHHLQWMQPDVDRKARKPILHGSDAGEGDFYFVAADLLRQELSVAHPLKSDLEEKAIQYRMNLIHLGNDLPQFYAQKFLGAMRKLEKYGADAMEKYFTYQPVTEEEGSRERLQLFQPNALMRKSNIAVISGANADAIENEKFWREFHREQQEKK